MENEEILNPAEEAETTESEETVDEEAAESTEAGLDEVVETEDEPATADPFDNTENII